MLEISGLNAGYGRVEVLQGIDLEVGEDEIVALVGSNGAGKTTLLRTVSGVIPAAAGSVRFRATRSAACLPRRSWTGASRTCPRDGACLPA